jgi:uncharacterized protein involved in copper resistance
MSKRCLSSRDAALPPSGPPTYYPAMRRLPLALLVFAVPACRTDAETAEGGSRGSFHASWVGADTGKLDARPRAVFCQEGNRLELMAVQGDAGIGLVIYPDSGVQAGTYDGFDPGADTVPRPGVAGAARWFTEKEIPAYQSDWGTLELTRTGATLAGSFALHMRRSTGEGDPIMLNGRFSGVIPGPCPADSVSRSGQGQ